METSASIAVLPTVDELKVSHELTLMMSYIDIGFAVYSSDLQLISANDFYYKIHGLCPTKVPIGSHLRDVMRAALMVQGVSVREADKVYSDVMESLDSTDSYKIEVTPSVWRHVRVRRQRIPSGLIIESAEDISPQCPQGDSSSTTPHPATLGRTRLSFALDAMADGFGIFDQEERLTAFNQQFVDSYEAEAAHLIVAGKPLEDLLREGIEAGIFNPEGKTPDQFVADRLDQHRNPDDHQIFSLLDGRYIRRQNRKTEDGCVVTIRSDITELRRQQIRNEELYADLQTSSEHLSFALSNMVQGLCMYDADQRLVHCNDQFVEMIGLPAEAVHPGANRIDLLKKAIELGRYEPSKATEILEAYAKNGFARVSSTVTHHFTNGKVIEIRNEPLANGGTIVTSEDVTQREKTALELARYTKNLERSNDELQDFAYVASHDLQEPLRKIEAFGDRLSRKYGSTLPEDGALYLERMQNAATRMRQLINDLLSYSRVTSENRPFDRIDLNEVMEGVLSDIQMSLEECEGRVELSGLEVIDADSIQMRQLFQNLISNGLKFAKEDVAPVIKIHGEKASKQEQNGLRTQILKLTVSDNGIGFENRYKDQIFSIFKRLHGRMEYEGTGIGLSTCRKIVERHNGLIDADGELGVGATFTIELPLEQKNAGAD